MCHQFDCGGGQARVPRGGWHHHWGCCCAPGYAQQRFPTREEVIEELEEYLKQLKAEAKGAEERLAELRKAA